MAPCATAGNIQLAIFFFQAEDGIRDLTVTGVQTCALPISWCGVQPALNATSGPLQCTIPALAPGQSMTIKFKMRAQTLPDKASGGTIYHEASVKPFETEWLSNGGDVIVNNTTTDRTSTSRQIVRA